ncbi:TonB-dependent siderophore receptor [Capnocytophaga sp. oral taxon 878]|uniref:TonB-dependent receptor plug domain-containing protein n=1 Tax=Capnocytophaga sp. oral taxon 878 TaxID=1316596 RepID=UPI000D03D7E7|nr:TonB-dependent receptor [Capnocytophaga sp. oral taxon 878]AVM49272.1 TonB-dependent receptor [Capnocytophaga sp. oral taxon 878]
MQKSLIITLLTTLFAWQGFSQTDNDDKKVELSEVIVTATRAQKYLKDVPITVQVVTADDIRKSQASDFQSFLETEFAGINFTYDGGMPNINMLGFGGKYVLFLVDGERMAGETFDNIDYNRIDLDNIERIEIIKGATSSLYGSNALGGVINIITKNAKKAFEGSASYLYESSESHKTNIGIGSKQKWGSIRVTSFYNFREPYTLKDSEPLRSYKNGNLVEAEKGELNIAGFTTYGVTPKVSLNISPKTNITITPNYYFSERNQGTEISRKVRDRYYNYTMSAKGETEFSENKKLSLSAAFDRYDKFNYYRLIKEQEKNYENTIWRAAAQYNQQIWEKHSLVGGTEVFSDQLLSFRFNNTGTEAKETAKNYTLFTQQEWAITPSFTLVTGARIDYHSLFKEHLTYRLSGMFKVNKFSFRGGYSSGFRSPTLKELYTNWFHPWGGGFQIMGNKELKPESSDNINLSVDFDSKKLNITAMTQFSSVKDKISYRWTSASDTIRYINFKGHTKIISSEVSATYRPIKALRLKSSYAYYYISNSAEENRPHTFTVKAEYIPKADALYIPNIIFSGKYVSATRINDINTNNDRIYAYYEPYSTWHLQLHSKLPYNFTLTAGINNIFGYVTKTTSFYSSISPGRTFIIGLKYQI